MGAVAAGCGAWWGGRGQVVGALAGAALVGAFFAFGAVTVSWVAAYLPQASMLVALLTYTLQVLALALVLVAAGRAEPTAGQFDFAWFGGTAIAATVAWTGALVRHAMRARDGADRAAAQPSAHEEVGR